jgi:HSP20 family protein
MMSELVKQPNESDVATVEQLRDCPVFVPRFDIAENDDELTLWGDMPGVQSSDFDIQFENRQLTVHGKVASRQASGQYLIREYGVGDFRRTFTIGESIDTSKIAAVLHDGVLTLRLPKTEEVKPRRIQVKGA